MTTTTTDGFLGCFDRERSIGYRDRKVNGCLFWHCIYFGPFSGLEIGSLVENRCFYPVFRLVGGDGVKEVSSDCSSDE